MNDERGTMNGGVPDETAIERQIAATDKQIDAPV
jgi:hypothetical protein